MQDISVPLHQQRICPSYGTPPGDNSAPNDDTPGDDTTPGSYPPAPQYTQPWGSPSTAAPSTNDYPAGYGQGYGYGHGYGNDSPSGSGAAAAASAPSVADSEYYYDGKTDYVETSDVNIDDDGVAVATDSEGDVCYL
ncbi:uncharacterized protein CDV56_103680 [Aspergillus thermomutatus]|uniref:Uncharacterized protein n=1 Tax=Aspergillus thermomutatus TaxID=41047 RepID=A0A397HPP0_ASPTH|nr:uncharacterized protein CDV56_103680 [Aspergillus thermomutatus]RHZ64907.1 hypothetical protein CDV56_103680 [Aspergillus thermomutatus]